MKLITEPIEGTHEIFEATFPLEDVCQFCSAEVELESGDDVQTFSNLIVTWVCMACGECHNDVTHEFARNTVIAEQRYRSNKRRELDG